MSDTRKQSVFSSNIIVPDMSEKRKSMFDLAERISIKNNSEKILECENENIEQLNDAGIAQLQHLSQEGSIWKMCKEGLLNKLKHKIENNNKGLDIIIKERGTFGETVLHVAALYKQSEIVKYLISKFPLLINEYYLSEEYYGENALHITVINRDLYLTEYLLKNGANPNTGRAIGRFFDRDKGTVYYGEHAITFAISTFQSDMITLLHKYGADLNVYDSFGNSVFHHCIRMNSPQIFDTLIDLANIENKDFDMSYLNKMQNAAGLSVLQYAVELGRKEIFDYMLEKMKIIGWEWGNVSFYAYPIIEIDTHGDNTHSVLETIITEHRSIFILNPVIYEVLLEKWNNYG
eukprot:531907_1